MTVFQIVGINASSYSFCCSFITSNLENWLLFFHNFTSRMPLCTSSNQIPILHNYSLITLKNNFQLLRIIESVY